MSEIVVKLAKIETNQEHLSKQMDTLVQLFDRMVRVEESQNATREKMATFEQTLQKYEEDLDKWRTARRLLTWISGIFATILAGLLLWLFKEFIDGL